MRDGSASRVEERRVEVAYAFAAQRDDGDAAGRQLQLHAGLLPLAEGALLDGAHLGEAHRGERVVDRDEPGLEGVVHRDPSVRAARAGHGDGERADAGHAREPVTGGRHRTIGRDCA